MSCGRQHAERIFVISMFSAAEGEGDSRSLENQLERLSGRRRKQRHRRASERKTPLHAIDQGSERTGRTHNPRKIPPYPQTLTLDLSLFESVGGGRVEGMDIG